MSRDNGSSIFDCLACLFSQKKPEERLYFSQRPAYIAPTSKPSPPTNDLTGNESDSSDSSGCSDNSGGSFESTNTEEFKGYSEPLRPPKK